jgi:HEAT repeat protein
VHAHFSNPRIHIFYLFLKQEEMGGRNTMFNGFRDRSIAYEINNLADEDSRLSAIRTLKAFGKAAIPQLVDVLGDPSRNAHAALILSEVGEPAIPALLDALGDESKKTFASAALNEMGKTKNNTLKIIISGLIDTLSNKSPQTRAIAGVTLLNFGAPTLEPFIPNLIIVLGNVDASPFAANVLIGIGKPVVGPLMNVVSDESKQEWVNTILQEIAKKDNTVHIPAALIQPTKPVPNNGSSQSPKPKFCKHCGASLASNSVYCSQCGGKVD